MNRSGQPRRNAALGGALACVLLATGCAREEPAVTAPPVPSVKTVQVQAQTAGSQRTLSGMLMVAEETRLSFAIGGKLLERAPARRG